MPSIRTILADAAERLQNATESPRLDAEILLCKVIGKNRSYLRTWPERELLNDHLGMFSGLIEQRLLGQPIAYLMGMKEFWSREFMVTPDVLIPRPETELLVEIGLDLIPERQSCRILDLGTGSGIIAVTLAAERPRAQLIATDVSFSALEVARGNAKRHQVNNIEFLQSDWFEQIPAMAFDLIISNPPYVADNDPHVEQGDLRFEPIGALIAGDDGLSDIKTIADHALGRLNPGGFLIMEHGYDQAEGVRTILTRLGYKGIKTVEDLAGLPRATLGCFGV